MSKQPEASDTLAKAMELSSDLGFRTTAFQGNLGDPKFVVLMSSTEWIRVMTELQDRRDDPSSYALCNCGMC